MLLAWDLVLFLRGLFTLIFEIGSLGGIKLASCAGIVNIHLNVYPLLCYCAALLQALRVPEVRLGILK